MEHHEGVYKQMIEVNNTNQATDYIPHHLVQEIIVQNDHNQGPSSNFGVPGLEIILPNDCHNIQNHCSSNIITSSSTVGFGHEKQLQNVILHQEQFRSENISDLNHEKIEYILQDPTHYQTENYGNNSVILIPNSVTSNNEIVAGTVTITNNTVPHIGGSDASYIDNHSMNNHSITNHSQTIVANSIENLKQEEMHVQENVIITPKLEEPLMESLQAQTIDPVTNVVAHEVTLRDSHLDPETYCGSQQEMEVQETYTDTDGTSYEAKTANASETGPINRLDYSAIVSEATSDTKIISNSDDNAVIDEYSSVEYSTKVSNPNENVTAQKSAEEAQEMVMESHDARNVPDMIQNEVVENEIINNVVELNEDHVEVGSNHQSMEMSNPEPHEETDGANDIELHLSSQSNDSQRKVIQDIFDDWQDENCEDENNQSLKEQHDSVEMELQNLLNDDAQQEQTISSTSVTDQLTNNLENHEVIGKSPASTTSKGKCGKTEKANENNSSSTSSKSNVLSGDPQNDRASRIAELHKPESKKIQSPRPGVKVPCQFLTSQIASANEVSEAVKERFREKQKNLESPKTPDIVFVQKITQRLSSQLLAAASTTGSSHTPLSKDSEPNRSKSVDSSDAKSSATADKELLAILEGDDEPDWSELQSNNTTEDNSKVSSTGESHTGLRQISSIERELALKQLQELPSTSKKKTKGNQRKSKNKDLSESDSVESSQDSKSDAMNDSTDVDSPKRGRPKAQNGNEKVSQSETTEVGVEESRSGRKRKLTEKAREHELLVKRNKVLKGKTTTDNKKDSQDTADPQATESIADIESAIKSSEDKPSEPAANVNNDTEAIAETIEESSKQVEKDGEEQTTTTPLKSTKKTKIGILKKDAPISKKKLAVKNYLRQKKVGVAKTKSEIAPPLKTSTPSKTPLDKSSTPTSVPRPKKSSTEIDKLLQDEGVVNLLYDVEQPDSRKRLVPITKSHKKIMDVEKAERELKLRTKLVRNAVMRLRNSSAPSAKISPRSRRSNVTVVTPEQPTKQPQAEKKSSESPAKTSTKSSPEAPMPSDFIIPAKIRNAADASRIIRRHSSSSFSSASASPRVSVDMQPESLKFELSEFQTKPRGRPPRDSGDKADEKKSKKKAVPRAEPEDGKNDKTLVEKEMPKKVTRSNVTPDTATKMISKTKKIPRSKGSLDSSSSESRSSHKGHDDTSARLTEAASALVSDVKASSRSSNASAQRKKGSNVSKVQDDEKSDLKKLSHYKEINVRRYGHLVQLILTPSTPNSEIRNAITIQVMNEVQNALLILKNDDDCRVVLFTTTGTSFCEGLDISYLLTANKEERKARAEEVAKVYKDFIKTLAAFNKPIVAGVQGAAIGLGVTMLPLFDLVIASDKATFSTPYGKLGQIAEGVAVFTLSSSLGSAVTNELLLGGRTLTASEALRAGLVTRVLWPDRFQGELLPSLKTMSEQSLQSMEATKALLRFSLRKKLSIAIESESLLLVNHWCSSECQEAIRDYIKEKGQ
ncbi:hypothetical protein QAD02_004092 [Eretmocerus hayati]|uniref:Uncharacterized protein n=1 Tax=Eretmocerus hayati TaxID=131215 RepID=A0ACC2NNZ9_9HYME|nr:hypothetical protein QAD02_004092 [Eretmocerus hayati]